MSNIAGKLLFASISAIGCGLGSWQVQRYYWKVKTIDDSAQSFANESYDLSSLSKLNELEGNMSQEDVYNVFVPLKNKKVSLSGHFIEGQDILLGLRSAPLTGNRQAAQGMGVNPQGYYVITPFKLQQVNNGDDIDPIIYINRGWISMKQQTWFTEKDNINITCIITEGEKVISNLYSIIYNNNNNKYIFI